MINFRRNGFIINQKNGDWINLTLPPSFSFDNVVIGKKENSKNEARTKLKKAKVVINQNTAIKEGVNTDSSFIPHLRSKWKILIDNDKDKTLLAIEEFLMKISDMYQVKDISHADSFRLLSLVTFCSIPGWVSFNDFVLLFTNFGEKNAILPKLIALLNTNKRLNEEGKDFVTFELNQNPQPRDFPCLYFNPGPTYGFIILWPDGNKTYILNDFNTPFFSAFLVDEKGNRYQTWDDILKI